MLDRLRKIVIPITSADHHTAPPATLAAWVQGHWGIENQLLWVRDVSFDEDRCQIRTGNAPKSWPPCATPLSLLRQTGWTNIAAGRRHHTRDPAHPVNLLLTW